MLCRNRRCAIDFVPQRKNQIYCTIVCRLRENGHRAYAKNSEVINKRSIAWTKQNPVKVKQSARKSRYQKAHGIPLSEKERRIQNQNYKCAVCETTEPGFHGWNTDHNHQTGQLRGELCSACNTSLGLTKENPAILQGLIEYLKKWSQ